MQRYFVDRPIHGSHVRLEGDQARHLAQVMRAEPGRNVVLFDGQGDEFEAEVQYVGRGKVELLVLQRRTIDREATPPVVLGVALPKGDRQRWLVEKAVETGVHRLVPLRTRRGVAQPVPSALERLRRAVIEASKQCGRNRLMEIADAEDATGFFEQPPGSAVRWISHPPTPPAAPTPVASAAALPDTSRPDHSPDDHSPDDHSPDDHSPDDHSPDRPLGPSVRSTDLPAPPIYLAVGPEGGWTDDELAAAEASGWQVVELGPRILRVETAAVVLTTLALRHGSGSSGRNRNL